MLLDASDGHDTWGSIGVSENIIEASWEALVDSLEAGMLPGRAERRARAPRHRVSPGRDGDEPIPLARPLIGEREEELVLETLRSRRLALGPRLAEFEGALAGALGAEHVSAVVERHRGAAPGDARRGRRGRATRW